MGEVDFTLLTAVSIVIMLAKASWESFAFVQFHSVCLKILRGFENVISPLVVVRVVCL